MIWHLFRAEWRKASGNRCLVGCTIWIWPILGFLLLGLFFVVFAVNADAREAYRDEPFPWTWAATLPWIAANNFIGRLFLMGFTASVFATEYHHRTWKAILPGNNRLQVILSKYLAVSAFIVAAFSAMMVVFIIGFGLLNLVYGAPYPPALSNPDVGEFFETLILNIALTFTTMLILSGIAALTCILTRSLLFGVMVSVGISLMESLGVVLFVTIAFEFLQSRTLADLYLYTMGYNADNVLQWVNGGNPAEHVIPNGRTLSLEASVIILAIYLVVLVGSSLWAFQRQDIQ
jgi:ABC-type transport system involved in multi-copper enzyme maturation permease subunit